MLVDDGAGAHRLYQVLNDTGIRAYFGRDRRPLPGERHYPGRCYIEKSTMDHHLIAAIKYQLYQGDDEDVLD